MKKLLFLMAACLLLSARANCVPCKSNAESDKTKADANKAFNEMDSQKMK